MTNLTKRMVFILLLLSLALFANDAAFHLYHTKVGSQVDMWYITK